MNRLYKNIKKYFCLIIIFLVSLFLGPFIFNDFSFDYFNNLVFWAGLSPVIILLFTLLVAMFISKENIK